MKYILSFLLFLIVSFWLMLVIGMGVSAGIKSACKEIVVMRGKKDAGEKQVE